MFARRAGLAVATALAAVGIAASADASAWKQRAIYQVLTDRLNFEGASGDCGDYSDYCGGNWAGLEAKLDYIAGMGFDALWISPVVSNWPNGYHGYWAQNLSSLNSHFGDAESLSSLISAAHSRGMWVMADVVANHMGGSIGSVGQNWPFNQQWHYHDCGSCPSSCNIENWNDATQVRLCRLSGLPDLNQTDPFVSLGLLDWVKNTVSTFGFDGVRVDTVPEVNMPFWQQFHSSANAFAMGEVFNGDVGYVASFQKGALPSVLSYPLFFTLRSVFQSRSSLRNLQSMVAQYNSQFADTSVLGTFIDNHDNARFLNGQSDVWLYRNAITYTILSEGIPIVYYGTEQGFNGGNDPQNREPLWKSGFNSSAPLYVLISQLLGVRSKYSLWEQQQQERYVTDSIYAFSRGQVFVAVTNAGGGSGEQSVTITSHPYSEGQQICNIFWKGDCVTVKSGTFQLDLLHGESKVFVPSATASPALRATAVAA